MGRTVGVLAGTHQCALRCPGKMASGAKRQPCVCGRCVSCRLVCACERVCWNLTTFFFFEKFFFQKKENINKVIFFEEIGKKLKSFKKEKTEKRILKIIKEKDKKKKKNKK